MGFVFTIFRISSLFGVCQNKRCNVIFVLFAGIWLSAKLLKGKFFFFEIFFCRSLTHFFLVLVLLLLLLLLVLLRCRAAELEALAQCPSQPVLFHASDILTDKMV